MTEPTRTLTLHCKTTGCYREVKVDIPKYAEAPKYRVFHAEDGSHSLQEYIAPPPGSSSGTWDQMKWK